MTVEPLPGSSTEIEAADHVPVNGSVPVVSEPAAAELPAPEGAPPAPPAPEPPLARRRLVSLDAFRGLTIFGMLLVNNIALDTATPRDLTHAAWNKGIHFADLVFPWFLFIVGVALPYAAASYQRRGLPVWKYDLKLLGRAASLFFLGCLIDSSLAKQPVFDLGVLQLIGLAYLVAGLLYELPVSRRAVLLFLMLLVHSAAIRFLRIPGVGVGVFTESKNLINHLNQVYLQPVHLNGLISVAPTSALVLIGTLVGDLLRREGEAMRKVALLLLGGLGLVVVGWVWSLGLPFNKPVWTASYIIYTAGLGTLLLAVLYLLIDVNGWRAWAFPLTVFGTNAIVAYVAPILVKVHALREWTWKMADGSRLPLEQALLHTSITRFGRIPGGWTYTLGYIGFWWLVLLWLHRKQIYVRV